MFVLELYNASQLIYNTLCDRKDYIGEILNSLQYDIKSNIKENKLNITSKIRYNGELFFLSYSKNIHNNFYNYIIIKKEL